MDDKLTDIQGLKAHDLKLTNDVLFKFIFGREERKSLTIAFLNDLLHDELEHDIKDLKFEPTEEVGSFKDEKLSVLDLACTLDSGERVDIEVQLADEGNFKQRTLFYWAELYVHSLLKGASYNALVPCICINILNFKLFENIDSSFTTWSIYEKTYHERFSKDLTLQFLELPKFKRKPKLEMTRIERWIALFNDKVSFEEKMEYAMDDPAMTKVLNTYDQFFANPAEVRQYLRQEIARLDYKNAMENREQKGRLEGRLEGRQEGRQEGKWEGIESSALAFIKDGLSKERVFKILKMTSEQIAEFLKKHKDL